MAATPNDKSKRLKVMFVVTGGLALAVLLVRGPTAGILDKLPLPGTLRSLEQDLRATTTELAVLEKERSRADEALEVLRETAGRFWIPSGVRQPEQEVQSEFEKLARSARVPLQGTRGVSSKGLTDNVDSVEFTVRIRGPMREVSRLFEEMERAWPPFAWESCTITPDNPRNPSGVYVNGKIRVYMLKERAIRLLEGRAEAEEDDG